MAKCFNTNTRTYFSPRPPLVLPSDQKLSLTAFLFRSTASRCHHTALVDADSGETLTFLELEALVSKLSHALSHTLGIGKNDVVLLFARNSIPFLVCFLAAAAIGAVITTCNPAYTAYELGKQIEDSRPNIAVATAEDFSEKIEMFDLASIILPSKSRPAGGSYHNSGSKVWDFSDLLRSGETWSPPHDVVSQDDVAAVLYSSGTTGTSKGAVVTHRNFIAAPLMTTSDQDQYGDPPSVFLCFLPMFHMFALSTIAYSQLRRGNMVVSMAKFELEAALSAVEKHRATHVYLVPSVAIMLAKNGVLMQRFDLSSLAEILSAAAPLRKDVMEGCAHNLPSARIIQAYGLAETCGVITLESGRDGCRYSGSTGHLCSGAEARIIDVETSEPLPPNQTGEIWLKGPSIMKEYLKNPGATKSTIDEKGWLHTGDIGYFDEDGQLFIVDRIKELIKCYGFQVAPAELEALLLSLPGILDAAVIPFPDEKAGEVPIAHVVQSPDSSLTEEDVQKFVEKHVASFKRLRKVVFVNNIPKSALGKILRKKLLQNVWSHA